MGKILQSAYPVHKEILSMEIRIAFNSLGKHTTIILESLCLKMQKKKKEKKISDVTETFSDQCKWLANIK